MIGASHHPPKLWHEGMPSPMLSFWWEGEGGWGGGGQYTHRGIFGTPFWANKADEPARTIIETQESDTPIHTKRICWVGPNKADAPAKTITETQQSDTRAN